MDTDYKQHHIHAGAWYFSDGWKPRLLVSWSNGNRPIDRVFTIQRTYARAIEAEQGGFLFAQKWIDDGKPDIEVA